MQQLTDPGMHVREILELSDRAEAINIILGGVQVIDKSINVSNSTFGQNANLNTGNHVKQTINNEAHQKVFYELIEEIKKLPPSDVKIEALDLATDALENVENNKEKALRYLGRLQKIIVGINASITLSGHIATLIQTLSN